MDMKRKLIKINRYFWRLYLSLTVIQIINYYCKYFHIEMFSEEVSGIDLNRSDQSRILQMIIGFGISIVILVGWLVFLWHITRCVVSNVKPYIYIYIYIHTRRF